MAEELPWARPFRRRCAARLDRRDSPHYYGRCELERHHARAKHALDRGMTIVSWTVFTHWHGR